MDKQNVHNVNTLDEKTWQEFRLDCMTDAERVAFLEQLLDDEDEMSRLASLELARMPVYLEEEMLESILEESSTQEITVLLHQQKREDVRYQNFRPPKWLQLLSYSVKITFAAACAVIALFQMPDVGLLTRVAEPDLRRWEQELLERELVVLEREQETIAREAEAEKRQQELLAEKEKRRQQENIGSSLVADVLQFISNKIFIGGMKND